MPSCSKDVRLAAALLACTFSLAAGGCAQKNVQAAAPATTAPVAEARPMTTAPDTDATPPLETITPPPTYPAATTPSPPPIAIPTTKPAAPRKPAGQQPAEEASAEPARPPAPQISAELSPGDQALYERKTNDDISVAEKNLQQTNGKQLSAAQQDLTAKIRAFLSQSLDASREGDWARAQNLSEKARLLSKELVDSL
jgi:hypothetical protein